MNLADLVPGEDCFVALLLAMTFQVVIASVSEAIFSLLPHGQIAVSGLSAHIAMTSDDLWRDHHNF